MQYEVKKKNIYEYVEWEGGKLINWQINTLSKINYKMAGGGRGKGGGGGREYMQSYYCSYESNM